MKRLFSSLATLSLLAGLVACGGGSSGTASNSLSGLAATGAAISFGAVKAKCVAGPEITGTTNVDGVFDLPLTSAHTPPCMLQVTGGTPTVTLHSFATAAGLVNISPITDLVVTKALGNSDPSSAYNSFDATKGSTISGNLSGAKDYVKAQVTAITGSTTIADPMSGSFKVGDADDKILDALGTALKNASKTVADLRPGASTGDALTKTVPSLTTSTGTTTTGNTGGTTTTGGGTTTTGGGTTATTNAYVTQTNPTGAANAPAQIVWTGSKFVAIEQNTNYHTVGAPFFTWTSSDGLSWTRNTTNMPSDFPGLSTANGLLFQMTGGSVTGNSFTVYSSSDAVNWTASTATYTVGSYSAVPNGVKYLNSLYFVSLDVDACTVITSTDASNWTSVNLKTLSLPTGYFKDVNTKYCSEPFFVNGTYVVYGGIAAAFNDTSKPTLGVVYTSTNGTAWTAQTFSLPTGVTNIPQGGRVNLAMQIGSNIVIPLSGGKVGTSTDGLTFTYSSIAGVNPVPAAGGLSKYYTNLVIPGGMVADTLTSANNQSVVNYYLTSDGVNYTAAPNFGFRDPAFVYTSIQAYSPTLRRLVRIKSVLSGQTNVPTTFTYDFPVAN